MWVVAVLTAERGEKALSRTYSIDGAADCMLAFVLCRNGFRRLQCHSHSHCIELIAAEASSKLAVA